MTSTMPHRVTASKAPPWKARCRVGAETLCTQLTGVGRRSWKTSRVWAEARLLILHPVRLAESGNGPAGGSWESIKAKEGRQMREWRNPRGGAGLSLPFNVASLVRPQRGPDRINHAGLSQLLAGLSLKE